MTSWLVPTFAYVITTALLGIFTKFGLKGLSWQEMILWAAATYVVVAAILMLSGTRLVFEGATVPAIAAGACAVLGLVLLFVALKTGDVKTVVPISSAYPIVAMLLGALFLSEKLTVGSVAGTVLVVAGVVLITLS